MHQRLNIGQNPSVSHNFADGSLSTTLKKAQILFTRFTGKIHLDTAKFLGKSANYFADFSANLVLHDKLDKPLK